MAFPTWLNPYEAGKFIEGVLKGNTVKRPLFMQQQFGDVSTTMRDTVNFDVEFDKRNVMGTWAEPQADLNPIQLPNFTTTELGFAYAKETVGSPDYSELNQRMLGEQPSTFALGNFASRYAQNIAEKTRLAYQRIENLKEHVATGILVYGRYTAQSQYHKRVVWDMGRPVYTTPVASPTTTAQQTSNYQDFLNTTLISEVDLTAAKMNASSVAAASGGASWDRIDPTSGATVSVTTTVDPIKDLNRMLETANYRGGTEKIVMSADAYSHFNAYLNSAIAPYAAAFSTTVNTNINLVQELLPYVKEIEGLVLRRMWDTGSGLIPIYTYDGVYHDRVTGNRTKYMPDGYVLLIPPSNYGIQRYGKIMHQKAMWQAMPTWVNYWQNEKTGTEEWELHTNFVFAHTDIRSVVCWKVCSTAAR